MHTCTLLLSVANRRDALDAAALDHGGEADCARGLRAEYHPDYYGAFVRDPDGDKIGACCHAPA